jgi:outer membrane protein TolC
MKRFIVIALSAWTTSAAASEAVVETLSIDDALARVEAAHPQVRERAAARLSAEVALRRARYDRVRVLGGARGGYAASAEVDAANHHLAGELFVDARLPVYAGGGVTSAIEQAAAHAKVAQADQQITTQELKRAALLAYANLAATELTRDVSARAKSRAVALVDLATRRRDAGVGAEADVARARLNLVRREESALMASYEVDAAQVLLRSALAADDDTRVALSTPLMAIASLRGRGARELPELTAARAVVTEANAARGVAHSGYFPTIELFASGSVGSGGFVGTSAGLGMAPAAGIGVDLTLPVRGAATGGVMLTLRAFDNFVTRDRVAVAEQSVAAASARLRDTERAARAKRSEAAVRYAEAAARLRVLSDGVALADDAARLARARYEAGTGIFTDTIEAELESLAVEVRRIDATLQLASARVNELRAEGVSF